MVLCTSPQQSLFPEGQEEIIFDALDRYDEALLGQRRPGAGVSSVWLELAVEIGG